MGTRLKNNPMSVSETGGYMLIIGFGRMCEGNTGSIVKDSIFAP